jgi:hypothetical protein
VGPEVAVPVAGMMMIVTIVVGIPLVRALGKRWDKEARFPRSDPESAQRLAHIEQAIDAMAVEIERISEGQRFVTRLLSERAQERVAHESSPKLPSA